MRVGIFMPVYNGGKYVRESIQSLLNQTWQDFRLHIVDDGSTDNTAQICSEMAELDKRISLTVFAKNRGEVAARNEGLEFLMRAYPECEFFMNHDCDDVSSPEKLAKLVAHMDANPSVAIVGCCAHYFGANRPKPKLATKPADIHRAFINYNSMINSAALIRRNVFETIGKYHPERQTADDYDFFARALMAGFKLENLPDDLHAIRLHPQSICSTRTAQMEQQATLVREMLKRHFMH